jgi:hypothetical protein
MGLRFRLSALIFGIVLTFSPANAQDTIKIKVSERYTLAADQIHRRDPARHDATHYLTLTGAYFTGTEWSPTAVVEAILHAAKVLEQCGLILQQIELVRIDAPSRYHHFYTPVSRELARALALPKPTIYFVTDTRQRPAFDAEAIGRGNSQTRPELADSVWVTRATRDLSVALAHELVHVLSDSGQHLDLPGNLMREETAPGNTRLTDEQCAQLRNVGEKNSLLRVKN